MKTCEKCKKEITGEDTLCPECRAETPLKLEDRKLSKKRFILNFADIGIIIVCLLVFLIPTFFDENRNISGKFEPVSYMENGSLYCKNLGDKKGESILLAEGLGSFTADEMNVTYSPDGTVVFFPSAASEQGDYSLSFYDFKTNGPVTPIAEKVSYYKLSADGTRLVCLSGDTLTCYSEGFATAAVLAQALAEDSYFEISDDCSKVVFFNSSNQLCLKTALSDAKVISADADTFDVVNGFSTIIIRNHITGYLACADFEGKVTEICQSGELNMLYDSGELYYTVYNTPGDEEPAVSADFATLYYYNGSESLQVHTHVDTGLCSFAENTACVAYGALEEDFVITEDTTDEDYLSSFAYYHSTGDSETVYLAPLSEYEHIELSDNGTQLYFIKAVLPEMTQEQLRLSYELYNLSLADIDETTEPELISTGTEGLVRDFSSSKKALYYTVNEDAEYTAYIFTEGGEAPGMLLLEDCMAAELSEDFSNGILVSADESYYFLASDKVNLIAAQPSDIIYTVGSSPRIVYSLEGENGTEIYRYNTDGSTTLVASGAVELAA